MKSFLRILLLAMVFLNFSNVTGAEEWKRIDLNAGTSLSIFLPASFEENESERNKNGEWESSFIDKESGLYFVIHKRFFGDNSPPEFKKKYRFDELTKDEEEIYIKTVLRGEKGESRFIILPNGHKALYSNVVLQKKQQVISAMSLAIIKDQYAIVMIIRNAGEFNQNEVKMIEEIFRKVKF